MSGNWVEESGRGSAVDDDIIHVRIPEQRTGGGVLAEIIARQLAEQEAARGNDG